MVSARIVALAVALLIGVALGGAEKAKGGAEKPKEDVRAKRALRVLDKKPRLEFVLPKVPAKGAAQPKKGPKAREWVFTPLDAARARDAQLFQDELKRLEGLLAEADDPDKKRSLPEEERKKIEGYAIQCRLLIQGVTKFYAGALIAVEEASDPTTSVVIKSTEIRREYTLESAVADCKQKPPPWLLGTVTKDIAFHADKANARIKNWAGWQVHAQFAGALAKEGEPAAVFHDNVFLYRRTTKKGDILLLEIHCRWKESPEKKKDFAADFEPLLRGMRVLD